MEQRVDHARLGWTRKAAAAAARRLGGCERTNLPVMGGSPWYVAGSALLDTVAGSRTAEVTATGRVAMWRGMGRSLPPLSAMSYKGWPSVVVVLELDADPNSVDQAA